MSGVKVWIQNLTIITIPYTLLSDALWSISLMSSLIVSIFQSPLCLRRRCQYLWRQREHLSVLFKPLIPHHTLTRYLLALKTESTSPESQLGEACKKLRHKLEQSRASIQSITFDEDDRPYPQTRSRQSSFGISSDDLDVLGNLRDNIDRLGYVLSGLLVKNNAPTSLGKRLRRKSSLEGDDDKIDRKKLYNGLLFQSLILGDVRET